MRLQEITNVADSLKRWEKTQQILTMSSFHRGIGVSGNQWPHDDHREYSSVSDRKREERNHNLTMKPAATGYFVGIKKSYKIIDDGIRMWYAKRNIMELVKNTKKIANKNKTVCGTKYIFSPSIHTVCSQRPELLLLLLLFYSPRFGKVKISVNNMKNEEIPTEVKKKNCNSLLQNEKSICLFVPATPIGISHHSKWTCRSECGRIGYNEIDQLGWHSHPNNKYTWGVISDFTTKNPIVFHINQLHSKLRFAQCFVLFSMKTAKCRKSECKKKKQEYLIEKCNGRTHKKTNDGKHHAQV